MERQRSQFAEERMQHTTFHNYVYLSFLPPTLPTK